MKRSLSMSAVVLFAAVLLSACGGGGGGAATDTTPVTPPEAAQKYPRYAYVVNSGDNTLSIYTINNGTGKLRHNGYVMTGSGPLSVTVDPSGQHVYVANRNDNTVSQYTLTTNGGLVSMNTPTVAAGLHPRSVTVHPSGKYAYVANYDDWNVSQFTIDSSDGSLTSMSTPTVNTGKSPGCVAVHPTGKYAYVVNRDDWTVSQYLIDTTDGSLTSMTTPTVAVPGAASPLFITVDPSGKYAYVDNLNGSSVSQFTINSSDGSLTSMSTPTAATRAWPSPVAFDPTGKYAYVANQGDNTVSQYTLTTGGSLQSMATPTVQAGSQPVSITVDPSGQFAYTSNMASDDISMYIIDQTSGALTPAGTISSRKAPFVGIAISSGASSVKYTPKYAYTVNKGSMNVSGFTIDAGTGELNTMGAPLYSNATNTVSLMNVHPSGEFTYIAEDTSDCTTGVCLPRSNIKAFSIDAATGRLSNIGTATFNSVTNSAVDPSGRFFYGISPCTSIIGMCFTSDILAYNIKADGTLGAKISGGPFSGSLGDASIAVDPAGRYLFVANILGGVSSYTIDPANGALSLVVKYTSSQWKNPIAAAVDDAGQFLYVVNQGDGTNPGTVAAFGIDRGSGALTSLGSVDAGVNAYSIAIDPARQYVYVANKGDGVNAGTVYGYSINADGSLTKISFGSGMFKLLWLIAGVAPESLSIDPSGQFMYAANYGDGTISAYAAQGSQIYGSVPNAPFTAGTGPVSIVTMGEIK